MDPHLHKYAERQAPRYTSYPTAPHFGPEIDGAKFANWLAELPPGAALSLYVHVPYCKRICWYCGCNTNALHAGDTNDFVMALMQEIDVVAGRAGAHRVCEIHWGGGTPNILSAEEFTRLFHHLDFWFDLDRGFAHSIEIDPRHLETELAAAYAAAGVTRASLGVQTFAPHVQEAIGRVQPFDTIARSAHALRSAGIGRLNFDLMYGLPRQSTEDLLSTIRLAASLQPDRVTLFGYAHVPWFKRRQRVISQDALPGPQGRLEQSEAARDTLKALGYVPVGIDHYAKPDDPLARAVETRTIRRNFQGYVEAMPDAIIGFGPSAISTFPQGYAQNTASVGSWRRALDAGCFPVARGHAHTADDLRRRALIEQLMCTFVVDLSDFGGRNIFAEELERLAPLAADGLVAVDGDKLAIPEAMRPFCRLVAQAFDAYAATSPTQHSQAI